MENEITYKKIKYRRQRVLLHCGMICGILLGVLIVVRMMTDLSCLNWGIAIASFGELLVIAISHKTAEDRKYSALLDEFIRSRELMQSYIDDNGKEIITYYPKIEYKIDASKNRMFLKFRLDGSLVGEKLDSIGQPLARFFETICLDIIEERGYIIYVLELEMQKQKIYSSYAELPQLEEGRIRLGNIDINWMKYPHCLISGITQTGKTTVVCQMAYLLKQQYVRVIYLDPKNDIELYRFCSSYNIEYYSDIEQIFKILSEVEEEMRLRQCDLDAMGLDEAPFNPVYIFFDEMIALAELVGKTKYEKVQGIVSSLILQGAKKRYYYAAILQRPDVQYLKGSIRENLHNRIVMGKASEETYRMVFPECKNVKNLRNEKGTGLIYRIGVDHTPKEILVDTITSRIVHSDAT